MPEEQSDLASEILDPRHLLIDWANSQDGWARRLVGHVIASQRPISDEQATELFELFMAEKGLDGSPSAVEPKLPYPQGGSAQSEQLRILSLSNVSGVNALSPGAIIDFSKGLTILYGENGTGKTGYARIFKRISAVQYPEEILPDINSSAIQEPSATIEYELGDAQTSIEWRNEVGISPFTRLSVFDSPSVNVRVDESLAYVYTPAEISLFSYVSAGIRAIQDRGSHALDDLTMPNPFLRHFERGTDIYQEIEALGPATDLNELETLAAIPEDAQDERERLEREVAALQSDAASGLLAAHQEAVRTLERLDVLAKSVEAFEIDRYNDALMTLETLRESYRRVREETFDPDELPGPADDNWQRFVTSAAEYLQHLETTHYPQDGDKCIYCRQLLDSSARSIIQRYATFLDDALGQQVSEQRLIISSMTSTLTGLRVDDVDAVLVRWHDEDPTSPEFAEAEAFAQELQSTISQVLDGERITFLELGETARSVRQNLIPRLAAHRAEVDTLSEQLADRESALQTAASRLSTLTAALELNRRLPEIVAFVKSAKKAARLSQVLRPLTPLLRSLTEKSKLASEDFVNRDFQGRFREECKALRTPSVRLEFIGREGRAQRRKSLTDDHRLSQILSEGQQKVLALADFLAEARMGGSSAPIVFDDPVNSLDHRRLKEVADRIAALVPTCQVVVFTHDIWLATELLSRFDRRPDECAYYMVSDDPTTGAIGKVDSAAGPRWDTAKALKRRVEEHLQEAEATSGAAQTALVEAAFGQMRSWCEVVVEGVIFGDVSRRYRANIMMGGLRNVHPERMQAAIDVIEPLFNDACRYMPDHSQPLPTLSARPTLAEAQDRWRAALEAVDAYRNPSS